MALSAGSTNAQHPEGMAKHDRVTRAIDARETFGETR